MGLGRSKFPISYEEACRRAGDDFDRLKETFGKYSTNSGLLPKITFLKDIFGDGMPPRVAETLYDAFNGGQKGIKFSDLLRGLVLLVYGTLDEKTYFIAQMLSEEGIVRKGDLQNFLAAVDIDPSPVDLDLLFHQENWASTHDFTEWIAKNPNFCSVTEWLLKEVDEHQLSFRAPPDPPTVYELLSKKFNIEQQDVMDIEKAYWNLKGSNGKFDETVLINILSPPLPEVICKNMFRFLDINNDSFIDLAEMTRGMALLCRGLIKDRIKVCFHLLDTDNDGLLKKSEMATSLELMIMIYEKNTCTCSDQQCSSDNPSSTEEHPLNVSDLLLTFEEQFQDGGINPDQFLLWSGTEVGQKLVSQLLQVTLEVCHIKMGLRPSNPEEEQSIIGGYMKRFKKSGRTKGEIVNLISATWFNVWRIQTGFEMKECPLSSIQNLVSDKFPAQVKTTGTSTTENLKNIALGPIGQPAVDVVEVKDDGSDDEDYTHVITNKEPLAASVSTAHVSLDTKRDHNVPGPISNQILCDSDISAGNKKLISLTNEGGFLRSDLKEYTDYYVVPTDVWKALVIWYGTAGMTTVSTLPRMVIDDKGTIELYPIMFKVFKHTTLPPIKQAKTGPWSSFLELIGYVRDVGYTPALPGDTSQPIIPRRVLYYTAGYERNTTIQQMCEHMQQVLHIKPEDLRIYNMNNEETPEFIDDDEKTIEELGFIHGQKILIETRSKDNTWPEELVAVLKEVENEELDKEKNNLKDITNQGTRVVCGTTGLSNLGNTCFMNSALQCLSNVQPLKTYFIERDHLYEINKKNPLGTKGVLAKRYGELLHDLWNGHHKSITPLKFRFTIARHAPQFNNFQQQDAQELLSFVLDGIHEDLNRVQEKPYKELRDSDDRLDHEVADEAWDYHLERNDSVIVDLLQGQLRSVVQCSTCCYKSVKFDPFTFLSLPLPLEQKVQLEVIVVPLDGSQPIRYGLKQELEEKYHVLKDLLAKMTKIYNFMFVDIFAGSIRSFPQDNQKVKTGLSGWLYAYEVPNAPNPSPLPHCNGSVPSIKKPVSSEPTLVNESVKPNSESDSVKPKTESDSIKPEAESDPVKPETESDSIKPEAESDSVKPETESDSIKPETESDSVKPETESDSVKPETESDSVKPKTESDSVKPKTESDSVQPETESDSVKPKTESDSVQPETESDSVKPKTESDSVKPETESDSIKPETESDSVKPKTESDSANPESENLSVNNGQNSNKGDIPEVLEATKLSSGTPSTNETTKRLPTYCSPGIHGFLFALHRKTLRMENYFVSSQKNRPVLFNVPMVVPCIPSTPRCHVYKTIWDQFQRMVIKDPPDSDREPTENSYPFDVKMVRRDGLYCCCCPWYRFCRGCVIPCDDEPIGNDDPHYLAVDWKDSFLHLRYQGALERPLDDESMNALKTIDTKPITLSDCFKAFSKDEVLGEDEYWYCKKCGDHRPAKKTLSIWRLPPILIVHLKRFQFHNGRWVKSQKLVDFPINGLEPKAYDGVIAVQQQQSICDATDQVSVTPPISEENAVKPLHISAEVHNDDTKDDNNEPTIIDDTHENAMADDKNAIDIPTKEHVDVLIKDSINTTTEECIDITTKDIVTKEPLDIPNLDDISDQSMYDLFAVTCHAGVLGGGHYTSFAKNPNNKWYYYNDSSCKETTEAKVLQSESAYMLFYELRGLSNKYNEFRAKNLRQDTVLKPNSSPPPANEDDDKEYRESLKGNNSSRPKKGGACRTQ